MAHPAPPAPKSDVDTIAEAIGAAIRANREPSELEKMGFSPEKIAQIQELPKPQKFRKVLCRSEETGSTFTALVVESRAFPHGRIITIGEDYKHPPGVVTYQSNGGFVPDGYPILASGTGAPTEGRELAKHEYNVQYLQWRWTEYYQKDLKRYSGKALYKGLAIDDAAWTTPWIEGRVGAIES